MKKSMLLLAFLLPGIFSFTQTSAEALTQSDILQHRPGAPLKPDNEQLYQAYLAASQKKDKHEIQRIIDLFYEKIKSLEPENRLEEIADVYEKIIEICQIEGYPLEKIPGCLYCQTHSLIESGKYKRALAFQLKVVALEEKIYLPDHPDLAISYYDLAQIYGHLGEYQKAVDLCVKATSIYEKNLSPDHLDLATGYNLMALAYSGLGDHAKALEFNLKVFAIREKVLSADDLDMAAAYNNIGLTYCDQGEFNKALEFNLKALNIHEKNLPSDHPDLATSYNNMGISYVKIGEYNKGLEFTLKALDIRKKGLTADHPDLANTYHNLALAYYYLRNFQKALEFNQKALAIFEKTLPSDHISLANCYNNLGLTYYNFGDNLKKALEFDMKAISIFEKILPADHPNLEQLYHKIGKTYLKDRQLPKAKVYFEKYQKISKSQDQACFNWALYYAALKDKTQALENLQKAVSLGFKDLDWISVVGSYSNIQNEPAYKAIVKGLKKG